jgi:hypothetical protein
MLKPVLIEHNESNNSAYGWIAIIDDKEVDLYLFPTLGSAQAFYRPFTSDWQLTKSGKWFAKFNSSEVYTDKEFVTLKQVLYVKD